MNELRFDPDTRPQQQKHSFCICFGASAIEDLSFLNFGHCSGFACPEMEVARNALRDRHA